MKISKTQNRNKKAWMEVEDTFTCTNCGSDDICEWFKFCPICGEKIEWEE